MSRVLLGIGGYAGAGKDAVADILENEGFARTFMSEPLNEILCELNPQVEVRRGEIFRYAELIRQLGYSRAKELPEVRRLLQVMGTEIGRNRFGPNVWTDALWAKLRAFHSDGNDVVVTGIRYPNERDLIHELNGETWWVERPGYGPVNSHSSDNSLTAYDFDVVVTNDGPLTDLKQTVLRLLQS